MRYHEATNFLFDLRRFQMDPGVEAVRELLAHVGAADPSVTFVQVAGSNGKGSTARMTESILREAGLRVGLYTSPHLNDLTERVRVDGRTMPEAAVAAFVAEAKPWLVDRAADGEPLTFFEVVTAMAVWQFDRADVDVAVLEVGMGGELDATSAVEPAASAVTNVSLEHTSILGETVEEIAETKAHVAPADRPLVTAADGPALATVREVAGDVVTVGVDDDGQADGELGTDDDRPDVVATYGGRVNHQEAATAVAGDGWSVEANLPLLGRYQAANAGVAVALAHQVVDALADGAGVDADPGRIPSDGLPAVATERGLRNAHWPGRFEVMDTAPLTVLDGAHNPDATGTLAETLSTFEYDDCHLVFAAMHGKDHAGMVSALPTAASVVTCRPNLPRAEDPEVLADVVADETGVDATAEESVAAALATARERADDGDCLLLTGSLYAVAEARRTWTRTEVPKRIADADAAAEVLRGAGAEEAVVERTRGHGTHRVLKLSVERRQARRLRAEMLTVGGECVAADQDHDGELQPVVLMGTLAQFDRLLDRLADQPWGLPALADAIRERLALDEKIDGAETTTEHAGDDATRGYPWDDGTAVMGVLNVTPDSFHDGGEYVDPTDAVARAEAMVEAGADIVDVGGESTRPGADPVTVEEELRRVLPVVEAVADTDAAVSVDTRKAAVGREAIEAGADILNDVTGLEDPEMRFLAAEKDVPVIVMHSIDAPVVPEKDIDYDDVVEDIVAELRERVLLAEKAGVPREHVVVDPGVGFGKSTRENFELLGRLGEFRALGCPVLFGHSHKSMFELVGSDAGDAPDATVAATALAARNGADVVRVHDVAENARAVRVAQAAADPFEFEAE
ncbi:MAG: dihydropteroate synthase [Halolamina sp.]